MPKWAQGKSAEELEELVSIEDIGGGFLAGSPILNEGTLSDCNAEIRITRAGSQCLVMSWDGAPMAEFAILGWDMSTGAPLHRYADGSVEGDGTEHPGDLL